MFELQCPEPWTKRTWIDSILATIFKPTRRVDPRSDEMDESKRRAVTIYQMLVVCQSKVWSLLTVKRLLAGAVSVYGVWPGIVRTSYNQWTLRYNDWTIFSPSTWDQTDWCKLSEVWSGASERSTENQHRLHGWSILSYFSHCSASQEWGSQASRTTLILE